MCGGTMFDYPIETKSDISEEELDKVMEELRRKSLEAKKRSPEKAPQNQALTD